MLSGNTFQFYDQIGSNIEEQGETTDGKRVQKHWREREREQLQTCNLSQEKEMWASHEEKAEQSKYILPN